MRVKTNIGTYYVLTGRFPQALMYYQGALAMDPDSKETLDRLDFLRSLWPQMPEVSTQSSDG